MTLNIGFGPQSVEDHMRMLGSMRRWISLNAETVRLLVRVEDLEAARAAGQLGITFDIEGMGVLDSGRTELVSLFYDLGVRWILVAYNLGNEAGGGCLDPHDGGLTAHGRRLLAEMKRVGMVVCCSHTGHRTAREVMEHADNPVIFSHSNPAACWPHRRNIPDDLMRLCAATGGYVGINGYGPFLGDNDNSTATWIRHIDYAVQALGPQHVALGSDFVFDTSDLGDCFADMAEYYAGIEHDADVHMVEPERLQDLIEGLTNLGYSPDDIADVLGGNVLRVARQVWR